MNFSKMTCAVAVAVLGAGAISAQEMGAAAAPVTPAPAAPAAAVPVAVPVPAVPVAKAPVVATPEDAGPQIVAENQKYAPTAKASKATDANTAVAKALRERGFVQGYDPDRGSIIQIGQAMDNMDNPASPDFMTVRELLVRQAELDAKIQIASVVRRRMNGSTRVNTPGTQETADFRRKFADQIAALEQQKAKVAELLQMLFLALARGAGVAAHGGEHEGARPPELQLVAEGLHQFLVVRKPPAAGRDADAFSR